MQMQHARWHRWSFRLGLMSVLLLSVPVSAVAASFTWLGSVPGDAFNRAHGISADGSTVVGTSYPSSTSGISHAFRWTAGGGTVSLGSLPGSNARSEAFGASADGSVIVGYGASTQTNNLDVPFRWTAGGGMQVLASDGASRGVSADGSVVVGQFDDANGDSRPFRWTQASGPVSLGTLAGPSNQNTATGVSADGAVVVGMSRTATGRNAFRWTSGGGMQPLGNLPGAGSGGGELYTYPFAVSANGLTVVGEGSSTNGLEAFRWTSGGGMVGLGDLPGSHFFSSAQDVSADGSIIIGHGTTVNGSEAVRWHPVFGIQRISDLLVANGLGASIAGWRLSDATAISDDGQTIAGYGDGPAGTQGWVAVIPVPEPSTFALAGAAAVALFTIARRHAWEGKGAF
jgi:probable HAF family extracellular repeat protein